MCCQGSRNKSSAFESSLASSARSAKEETQSVYVDEIVVVPSKNVLASASGGVSPLVSFVHEGAAYQTST